jgi:hypothetical protein
LTHTANPAGRNALRLLRRTGYGLTRPPYACEENCEENCEDAAVRSELRHQVEEFRPQVEDRGRDAGNIGAGTVETGNKTVLNRVAAELEYDRDYRGADFEALDSRFRERPFVGCFLTLRLHPRWCSGRLWTLSRRRFLRFHLGQRLQRYKH